MPAPGELLFQLTETDSGLGRGQAEHTAGASKPPSQQYLLPHHPFWVVAIPGKPARFTITDEDNTRAISGGKMPVPGTRLGWGRAQEAPTTKSFPDLQPRHSWGFPHGLSQWHRVDQQSHQGARVGLSCLTSGPKPPLHIPSLPCTMSAPTRPSLPAGGQPGGGHPGGHTFCRV